MTPSLFARLLRLRIPIAGGMLGTWKNLCQTSVEGIPVDEEGDLRIGENGWVPPRGIEVVPNLLDPGTYLLLLLDLGRRKNQPIAIEPDGWTWTLLFPVIPHTVYDPHPVEALVRAFEETIQDSVHG